MPFDLLITNASVINADGRFTSHIGISEGRITALIDPATPEKDLPPSEDALDAQGRLVIPGGVDPHCHVEQVTGLHKTLDTFEKTTVAALHGGTTTIIDFGIPAASNESPLEAVQKKLRLIEGARCDVALHGAVISWDDTVPDQLEWMANAGIRSVKLYTTNRGTTMADETTIVNVMKEMVRLDGLIYVHSEHDAIIEDRVGACVQDQKAGISNLHRTRPSISEEASVREILAMAEYTGAPVYFVHQSTPGAVDAGLRARNRGQTVYSETCPHYLFFDDSVYSGPSPEKYACCPPMRPRADVNKLIERLARGAVDIISSDHSCYDLAMKQKSQDDVRNMPHGLPGVETRMPAAFTTMVKERGLSYERFVDVFSTAPARINGLARKGKIAIGFDADIVLFDPEEVQVVTGTALHMGSDFSPFEGQELVGWPSIVISGGKVVINNHQFFDPGPVGAFVRRLGTSGGDFSLQECAE